MALFVERAQAVRAGSGLTEQGLEAVAAIAHRLDGLPLALELAAARARWLSPQAILEWLEQEEGRLKLLTDGARNLAPRQQTLRNAIAWSYNLLTPDEQAVFRRVAVFMPASRLKLLSKSAAWTSREASCWSPWWTRASSAQLLSC